MKKGMVISAVMLGCLSVLGKMESVQAAEQVLVGEVDTSNSADESVLDIIIKGLCLDYDLDETNFSLCYYNTVTGESYNYNENAWMKAASTYKLPLNMYYYDLENAGILSPDTVISGYSLSTIHYESIVNSNNEMSEAIMYNLGSYSYYKELIFDSYGDYEYSEIDEIAWRTNYFTTRYMMSTLKHLYENADSYTELLEYMGIAKPDAYFKKYVTEYEIAHKYGTYDTAENDVGIVYTEEPYLLAIYTYGLDDGEDVVGKVNEVFCQYNSVNQQVSDVLVEIEE